MLRTSLVEPAHAPYREQMFDVRKLTVFAEVARRGSMSAAATATRYTTSAVSQQITALERDLGHELFVRTPNGVRLTVVGQRLLHHVPGLLDGIAAAERDLDRAAGADSRSVRLVAFSSAAATIVPPTVARLRRALPEVDVQILVADPDDGVAVLADGDADACVVTEVAGAEPHYPGLVTAPVCDDEFLVVLPRSHRLATCVEVPLLALAHEQWIVSSATGRCPDAQVFRNSCERAGFSPEVSFESQDYATVQAMVAAGLGVSLVPALAIHSVRTDVAVRPIGGPRPSRRIAVATTDVPAPNSPVAILVGLLKTAGAGRASRLREHPAGVA
ncbi:LysR family transcriptional regulator [Gordonia desulfuricans]|nr:LysR family transcriptional regulator [Gordonia desulfuricans]